MEVTELAVPTAADPLESIATIRSRIASVPVSVRSTVGDILDEAEVAAHQPGDDQPVVMHNDFDFSNMVLADPVGP